MAQTPPAKSPKTFSNYLLLLDHDGKGANGSKNRPHDAYPVRVASPATTNHAAKGSVFVNLRNGGNLKKYLLLNCGALLAEHALLLLPLAPRLCERERERE